MLADHGISCSCDVCKHACRRACWPTPEEAEQIIKSGFGHRMMMGYWAGIDNIYIIAPAERGYEGRQAPSYPARSGCVFQDKEGLCKLHNSGYKPIEGRLSLCDRQVAKLPQDQRDAYKNTNLHHEVAKLWDTDKGRAVVEMWEKERDHAAFR